MKRAVRTSMWVVMGLYLGSLMCFAGIGCSDDGGDAMEVAAPEANAYEFQSHGNLAP